jgi:hypothetical protein
MEATRRGVGGALAQRGVAGRGSWASGGDADEERESSSPEGKRGERQQRRWWRMEASRLGLEWPGLDWMGGHEGMGLDCWARIRSMARRPGREHGERCEHGEPLSFDALVPVLSPLPISRSNECRVVTKNKKTAASQLHANGDCLHVSTSTPLHRPPSHDTQPLTRPARLMRLQSCRSTPHRQNPSAPRQPCSLLFGTPSHGSRTLSFWTAVAKITAAACCPMPCPPPSTAAPPPLQGTSSGPAASHPRPAPFPTCHAAFGICRLAKGTWSSTAHLLRLHARAASHLSSPSCRQPALHPSLYTIPCRHAQLTLQCYRI